MDLQGVLFGVGSGFEEKPPAEGEWSLRRIIAHIIGADLGFYVIIKYTLGRYLQGLDPLVEIDDETWLGIAGMDGDGIDALGDGPLSGLQLIHYDLHKRDLTDFAEINDDELDKPSKYWEDEPMSLRFRMFRFDSHLRQHTIQAGKTLQMLGYLPNEVQRLLRLICMALGQVEGIFIKQRKTTNTCWVR